MSGTVAVVPVASTTACRAIRVRTQPSAADDLDGLLAGQPAVAADHVDPGAVRPLHLAGVVVVAGERVPPAQHGRPVEAVVTDDAGTPGMCRAASSTSIGRSSALLGMHAQYEHSPPSSSCSTITAVRSLPWMAYCATISPGGPPPITMTS